VVTARKTAGQGTSPAKKTTAKKTTAKKTTAKKTTAKKSTAKKSAGQSQRSEPDPQSQRSEPEPVRVAGRAAEQLLALTGREPEGVTGLERTDDGWTVHVELLELRRVPSTTDVVGLYEVRTDEQGELQGYRRLRRYARGAANDE
jgi:hypothetical protein